VEIKLETGRSHQIRVQFSSRKMPLYGDQKYNSNSKVGEQLALFAKKLSFKHPITNELLTFELPLPERKPFNLFKFNNNY
jgi:23S rRNA pseudouridine1911/1915/1917 synthase